MRETFTAEDGATLRGAERNRGVFAALRADGVGFHPSAVVVCSAARCGRGGEDGYALGLASLAALGFVLELLIVEEQLFARGENKLGAAIDAGK